jgi:hypothetical protein
MNDCSTDNTNIARAGNISIEAFTCMLVFKNMFSFGLTWSGYDWIVKTDFQSVFIVVASVQVGVCALTIPLCKLLLSGLLCRSMI